MLETNTTDDTENKYEHNQDVEQECKLIEKAYEEFSSGKYEQCLETLDELEKYNGTNNKLQHNRAVTKFYQCGCKDHVTLLEALKENANKAASPIARYNMAVIYYHRHMFQTAIETLMPLVNQLDDLEEQIAGLVSTFTLRLLLVTNQLRKAAAFLEMLQSPERNSSLNLNRETLLSEEASSSELAATNHESFQRAYKFLAVQTCVLNRKPIVVAEDGSAEFSALKAHQYYIMKDFQMAAKQLKKVNEIGAMSENSYMLNTCIANNMGVIHLRVRHYAIAAKFFQDAIAFDKHIAANMRNISLYEMSTARTCEILYNLGIAMLHLRRPKEAYKCFLVPLKSYHSNPRLWFRISEACIMDHEMKMLEEDKKPMITSVANTGGRKMYFLKPSNNVIYEQEQVTEKSGPTLRFAAMALRNALTLTTYYKSVFEMPKEDELPTEAEKENWRNVRDNNFCNPSRPISKTSFDNMLCAIHAAYSYVSLCLGDYMCAYEMAQELLKAEKLSDAHRLLAHMYAGEALIMLDRLSEARPHFEPTFVSSLNAFDFETKDWRVKSLDAAQNVVRYNLAVVMALQGDFELSRNCLSSCTHPIVAAKVLSLKTYLDIKMGKGT
ncbi:CCR4-NOT transcription complex subunit 10 isoform X1 [Anastrepha obliqua]|uniref:CCR4-NOT transcription complex subunit 10 isoform X1 n=1 Tax=Anastrepha obliqua TaxID=95512 RepID=UPI00240A8ED8|nr:CCR4-NOT transcription complex subunit 10 isoform X1 [Anastrepha obliqua]